MSQNLLITKEGLDTLREELDNLKKKRPAIIEAISEARSHGDLRENSEYAAAKDEQRILEHKIVELESRISTSEAFDPTAVERPEAISFGAYVKLESDSGLKKEFRIVSELEADIEKGTIAINAPIAAPLLNKTKGNIAEVKMGNKTVSFTVKDVQY